MRYEEFKALVAEKGWTLAQVRCDIPPSEELLAVMDAIGLERYEQFAHRLTRAVKMYDAGNGRMVTVPE